jgi:hypothetical protein
MVNKNGDLRIFRLCSSNIMMLPKQRAWRSPSKKLERKLLATPIMFALSLAAAFLH